ncbi:hypothetical protein H6F61_25395 [Cyanobacteria bacterium FACHB-472]|nr:hypothetical protein [Cyanobacteria bacterium FACHB-472]
MISSDFVLEAAFFGTNLRFSDFLSLELEFLGVITYLTTDVILSYLNSAIA